MTQQNAVKRNESNQNDKNRHCERDGPQASHTGRRDLFKKTRCCQAAAANARVPRPIGSIPKLRGACGRGCTSGKFFGQVLKELVDAENRIRSLKSRFGSMPSGFFRAAITCFDTEISWLLRRGLLPCPSALVLQCSWATPLVCAPKVTLASEVEPPRAEREEQTMYHGPAVSSRGVHGRATGPAAGVSPGTIDGQ